MIELWKPNKLIARLLPQQSVEPDRIYRLSQFAFPCDADGRQCLFHTLTRQCHDLEDLQLPGGVVPGADLARSDELRRLVADSFFVPATRDEDDYYVEVIRLLRRLKRREGRVGFTILTTTACNARCVYCYEEKVAALTMTPEIAGHVVDFICDTRRRDATLKLNWFGGEPLLSIETIDWICRGLEALDIPFESTMVTNGSLIDDTVLDRMTGLWRMRKVQISMDGDEETYIRRKNYCRYRDEYHRVLDAAVDMARRGVRTVIRVNVDWENLNGVERFVADLDRRMAHRSEVSFCLRPLYGERRCEGILDLWERIGAFHMALSRRGYDVVFDAQPRSLKLRYCMADDPYGTAVITPDGQLHNCEHFGPGTAWGSLTEGLRDRARLDLLSAVAPVPEKCRGCAMLPECTTSTQCPLVLAQCREVRATRLTWALRHEVSSLGAQSAAEDDDLC